MRCFIFYINASFVLIAMKMAMNRKMVAKINWEVSCGFFDPASTMLVTDRVKRVSVSRAPRILEAQLKSIADI
jgi:hypothetical protein